jgi:hypothetical protein
MDLISSVVLSSHSTARIPDYSGLQNQKKLQPDMQDSLYEYLILNRQLSLPGIGTLVLNKKSAEYHFREKSITSPAWQISLENTKDAPSRKLFSWLAATLKISEWDATRGVHDFSQELKNKISSGDGVKWEKVGTFRRNEAGEIVLDSAFIHPVGDDTVIADKVLRENAEHTVLVGEQKKSSLEMEELLSPLSAGYDVGFIIAVVATVLSILFIGWHFSENGMRPSSTANHSVIQTTK